MAIVLIIIYAFCINWDQLRNEDKQFHLAKARELRQRLGISLQHKFALSTEQIPIWCKQSSFTILQAEHFNAAVRLDCLREDFDIKHIDGFCMALRGTSSYDRICDWILEICQCLLNPSEQKQKVRKASSSGWVLLRTTSNQIRDESTHGTYWIQNSTQDERFEYFRNKLGRLQIMRENNNDVFERVKEIVDECMIRIGNLYIGRFVQLVSEAKGHELRCYVSWQDWCPQTRFLKKENNEDEKFSEEKINRAKQRRYWRRSGSLSSALALLNQDQKLPSLAEETHTRSLETLQDQKLDLSRFKPEMKPAMLDRSQSMQVIITYFFYPLKIKKCLCRSGSETNECILGLNLVSSLYNQSLRNAALRIPDRQDHIKV